MYGDTYLTTDFQNIFKKIKNKNKSILFINKKSNQYDKSNVYFDKIKKKFIYDSKLNKNINYNYIDYGLSYVFNDELDIMMQDKKIIDMKYFFDFSSKKDTLDFVEINNLFYEIGSFKGITRFQNEKPYKNFL